MSFHQVFRRIRVTVVVLAFCVWWWGRPIEAVSPKFRQYHYVHGISAVARAENQSLVVTVTNANDKVPSDFWPQNEYHCFAIVPGDQKVEPVVTELEGWLYRRNQSDRPTTVTINTADRAPQIEPSAVVRYEYMGRFRDWHIGVLKVGFQVRSREGNDFFTFRRVSIRLPFTEVKSRPAGHERQLCELEDQLLASLVVNKDMWRLWTAPPRSEVPAPLKSALSWIERMNRLSKPAIRMRVYEEGLYALSGEQIAAAGVDPAVFDAQRLNLYRRGVPVPIQILPSDNRLTRHSRILFYCPPLERWTPIGSGWAEFWLVEEPQVPDAPTPMRVAADPQAGQQNASGPRPIGPQSVDVTRRAFDFGDYFPAMPPNAPNGMWFTESLYYLKPRVLNFEVDHPARQGEAAFTVYFKLIQPRDSCSYEIYVNGVRAAVQAATGPDVIKASFKVPAALLRDGVNRLGVLMAEVQDPQPTQESMLIGFEWTYPRLLEFTKPAQLFFSRPDAQTELHIFKPHPSSLVAWEIQDGRPIRSLTGLVPARSSPFTVRNLTAGARRIAISTEDALLRPQMVQKAGAFDLLNDDARGDLLLIVHPGLLDPPGAEQRFVEWKREQGFTPLVVSVTKVYDHFGFGEKSDQAVFLYLRYALDHWQTPPLQWVILVGEASDYPVPVERATRTDIQLDLLPTMGFGRPFERVRSDSGYALMDGQKDLLPDLSVARIPASSREQAQAALDKLADFEKRPQLGPQVYRTLFLADDEPEFSDILDQMIQNTIPPVMEAHRVYQRDFPYEYYWRVFMRRQSPMATDRLITAVNDGLFGMLFFGHGGPNIWTGERLLHINDVHKMQNRDRLTFVAAATCNASWLDFPLEPGRHALGEHLITHPDGGAWAMFAPTTGTTPSEHEYLMTYLLEGILQRDIPTAGAAMLYCKARYGAERANSFVLDQYILTGDPTGRFPRLEKQARPLNVVPAAVNYYEKGRIHAQGEFPDLKWGSAGILVTDPNGRTHLLEDRYPIYNGRLDYTLELPEDSPEGLYQLSVQGIHQKTGAVVRGTQSFRLVKPKIKAEIAVLPLKPVFVENEELRARLAIHNDSDVPVNRAVVRVTVDDAVIREERSALAPRQIVTQDATIRAQPGAHEIKVQVLLDAGGETTPIASDSKVIVGAFAQGGPRLFCRDDDIEAVAESLSGDQPARVRVRVHNLGHEPLDRLIVEARNAQNRAISEPALIAQLPEAGTKDVELTMKEIMPPGQYPIVILIAQEQPERAGILDPLVLRAVTKTLWLAPGHDLEVEADSIEFESQHFLVGETVFITAVVTNRGSAPSREVTVRAYRNNSNIADNQAKPAFPTPEVKVPVLQPGQSHKVRLRWDNTDVVGYQNLIVVADPDRSGGEKYWENNSASRPIFIKKPANLRLRNDLTEVTPDVITRRSRVHVKTVIENNGDWNADPATFEVFELGVAGDQRPLFPKRMLPALVPGQQTTEEFSWAVQEDYPALNIVINRLRDAAESSHSDNTFLVAPPYVFAAGRLAETEGVAGAGTRRLLSLSPTLIWGRQDRVFVKPSNHLQFVKQGEPVEYLNVPFSPDLVLNPEVTAAPADSDSSSTDNFWEVGDMLLQAGPDEDPQPIRIAVPVPAGLDAQFFDLYILGRSSADVNNYPASFCEVRVGGDSQFHPLDWTREIRVWGTDRLFVGRYPVGDGVLELEIRKNKTGVWTTLYELVFAPYRGRFDSPVYFFPRPLFRSPRGRLLLAGEHITPESVRLSVRCGEMFDEGRMLWTNWSPIPLDEAGRSAEFSLTGRYLQFQLQLAGEPTKEPIITAIDYAADF
ncbi:MAG: hypothetical protein Kow0059_18830 [Candidatus Sumerlaeia bacterium]